MQFTGADFTTIDSNDPARELFYDPESVVTYGVKDPEWLPKEKPRKREFATVIRELGELVVHDVDLGILGTETPAHIEKSSYDLEEVPIFIHRSRFVERNNQGLCRFVTKDRKIGKRW